MNARKFSAAALLAGLSCVARAQAPAPVPTPVTIDQEKGGDAARQTIQRTSAAKPGATPPPMNIRIREEGIKLPKCAAESREGEACKK
jgi:hypothetical protein